MYSYFQYAARDIILARLQKYCKRREGGREEGREGGRDVREEECVLTLARACAAKGYSSRYVCLSVSLSVCLCTLNLRNGKSNDNKTLSTDIKPLAQGKICVKSLLKALQA